MAAGHGFVRSYWVLWAALFYLWFRNSPRQHRDVNAAELALIEFQPVAAADRLQQLRPSARCDALAVDHDEPERLVVVPDQFLH